MNALISRTVALSAAGLSVALLAPAALAVPISGSGALGSFTGTLTYTANTGTTGTLNISLTNTSSGGGRLTGLVVGNSLTYPSLTISLISTTNAAFLDTNTEGAPPIGSFQGGAALGADWVGGGSPNAGPANGGSVSFVFSVSGTGAGLLTANSFIGTIGGNEQLAVRIRGFDNGGSDKIPGVPTPGAAALMGLGGLMASRRRR